MMTDYLEVFERHEEKYLLSVVDRRRLLERIGAHLSRDVYFDTTVCSLYYDTPDHLLVNRSLGSPVYKEKLRVRSYGVPTASDLVFVEIKKKFRGIVYKRRVACSAAAAHVYLSGVSFDEAAQCYPLDAEQRALTAKSRQIVSELDFMRQRYFMLEPSMLVSVHRLSYLTDDENPLRLTFDDDVRWRDDHLDLSSGVFGTRLIDEGQTLMEVKCAGAYPVWLVKALDRTELYPQPFSKYGKVYQTAFAHTAEPVVRRAGKAVAAQRLSEVLPQTAGFRAPGMTSEKGVYCA